MNTTTTAIPMHALLTMLNSMSRSDRRWLVSQLSEQVEREEEEEDNANLDAFLANVSGEWGGDKEPQEIANDLRHGYEMVRNVDTW
jgi:hypothetical protein